MKFAKRNSQHVVLISYKFHGGWPHCYKTIRGKVSVIVYAYRQVCACKVMAAFLDTMHSFKLHVFWWIYMLYVAGQFL